MKIHQLTKLEDTKALAHELLQDVRGGTCITLSGPIGAGKTTFTQYIGEELGITEAITSPTFTLMNIHELPHAVGTIKRLVHIDAYRAESAAELRAAGIEDFISDPAALILIEWPELCEDLLKDLPVIKLRFSIDGPMRTCTVE